jgi:hypothetical protein
MGLPTWEDLAEATVSYLLFPPALRRKRETDPNPAWASEAEAKLLQLEAEAKLSQLEAEANTSQSGTEAEARSARRESIL